MPVTSHNRLKPGQLVSIVLKADQRTGKQVQGTVAQLLTRHDHPRGIKVKLSDGRVGRVQQILPQPSNQTSSFSTSTQRNTMTSNNPWADAPSQGSPYGNQQQGQNQRYYANYNQTPEQPQQENPWGPPQQQQQPGGFQGGYSAPQGPPPSHNQQQQQYGQQQQIHRSNTDQMLVGNEGDRAAQVEHMQQYEANAPQSEDDRNQAALQKQFPNIDSSLIAAIYNERKPDMAEVRELLQELNS